LNESGLAADQSGTHLVADAIHSSLV